MKKFFSAIAFFLFTSTGKAAGGDSLWAVDFIHDIYFNFSQTGYWDTLLANHSMDIYTECEMVLDGRSMPSTGIKMKGNSSFNNPGNKKSFKVDLNEFNPAGEYDEIKKFNLNNGFKDPTFMREKVCLDFLNRNGMVAPRCTYARVYLNNVYWGLYILVEEVSSSKFLKQRYPDNDGNLFKGDPNGDMKWYGSAQSGYYNKYSLETNETQNDWSDLVHVLDIINNTSPSEFYDSLETVFESWSAVYYMAAMNIFANLDSYIGSGHNFFVYDDSTNFMFHWIPWDVNEAFGNFNMGMNITQLQNLPYNYVNQPANRPVATKMLADPTYHAMYISAMCDLMQDFSPAFLDTYIDSISNKIRNDVYADNQKFFSNQQFEDNINMNVGQLPGLKSFIAARRASLTSQLSAYGCWLSMDEAQADVTELIAWPNPANASATILLPFNWIAAETNLQLSDATGREAGIPVIVSGNSLLLDVTALAAGIYFVTTWNETGQKARSKLVVSH